MTRKEKVRPVLQVTLHNMVALELMKYCYITATLRGDSEEEWQRKISLVGKIQAIHVAAHS